METARYTVLKKVFENVRAGVKWSLRNNLLINFNCGGGIGRHATIRVSGEGSRTGRRKSCKVQILARRKNRTHAESSEEEVELREHGAKGNAQKPCKKNERQRVCLLTTQSYRGA